MNQGKFGICAFCGKPAIVTDDHVPPRNIFPSPQPNDVNLTTVPSCIKCNGGSSTDDEQFKIYIALKSGIEGEVSLKLLESARRTVIRNKKIRKQISDNFPLFLPSSTPSVFEKQYIHKFNPAPIRRIGRKIIKGLYFKHFGECLEGNAKVSLYLSEDLKMHHIITAEKLAKDTRKYGEYYEIGKNQEFRYTFARTENKFTSSWVLMFNNRCAMIGITIPINSTQ